MRMRIWGYLNSAEEDISSFSWKIPYKYLPYLFSIDEHLFLSPLKANTSSDYPDGADRSEGARGARCADESGAAARSGRRRQPISGRPARRPLHHTQDGLQQFFLANAVAAAASQSAAARPAAPSITLKTDFSNFF